MSRALMPDGIAAAFVSQYSFLFPAVFAMDRSETRTNLELHSLRFLLSATPGAYDHPGFVSGFFCGAVTFFGVDPVTYFIGKLPLPSDGSSYRGPSNANDDLVSLILFTPFPDVRQVAFRLWDCSPPFV